MLLIFAVMFSNQGIVRIRTHWQTSLSHHGSAFQTSKIICKHLERAKNALLFLRMD